ncbi:MAG: ribonuclease HII [Terriglobia bacterium]
MPVTPFKQAGGSIGEGDLYYELQALELGFFGVAGVDEVGRGALFGPVCVAAVILDLSRVPEGIRDSKKLKSKQRQVLAENIRETAVAYSIAFVEAGEIDQINILQATIKALQAAVLGLKVRPDFLLIDGTLKSGLGIPELSIIKGDALSVSIGAASILAKVARDQFVSSLEVSYPGYGLSRNMGYGTAVHLEALSRLGPTDQHRKTFRGVVV